MTNHPSHGAAQDVRPDAKKCYFVGGGIGSLAGAAFAIRDGVHGVKTSRYSRPPRSSADASTAAEAPKWELFETIPSLDSPDVTVFGEFVDFNERHVSHSPARLVDRNRNRVDVRSMGVQHR